jgi:preprotein translocase subunit SecG
MIFALTEATNTASKALTPDQIMGLIFGIALLVLSVALVVLVLFQSGKDKKLSGSIAGGSDTYFGKSKGRSWDKILARLTTVIAILFGVLVVVLYVLIAKN